MKTPKSIPPCGLAIAIHRPRQPAPHAGGLLARWHKLVLPVALVLLAHAGQAVDVYDFESLTVNSFIGGQDHWKDQPGQGDAVVALDESGHGTKVVRHFKTVVVDESAFLTRTNDARFNFVSFTGSETNAVIQFEANGEHVAMFALGCDLNGDGLLTSAGGEIGPALGSMTEISASKKPISGLFTTTDSTKAAATATAATTGTGSSCG